MHLAARSLEVDAVVRDDAGKPLVIPRHCHRTDAARGSDHLLGRRLHPGSESAEGGRYGQPPAACC